MAGDEIEARPDGVRYPPKPRPDGRIPEGLDGVRSLAGIQTPPQGWNLPARLALAFGTLGLFLALVSWLGWENAHHATIWINDIPFFGGGCIGALLGLTACALALSDVIRRLQRPASGGLIGVLTGGFAGLIAVVPVCVMYVEALAYAG